VHPQAEQEDIFGGRGSVGGLEWLI